MTPTSNAKLGLVALGIAGLLDVSQLVGLGTEDSPTGVILTVAALGVLTLVGVAAAWRGSRAGLLVAIGVRVVSAGLGIPAYFLDAPSWVLVLISAMLVLTVLGIGLVAPGLRRSGARTA